MDEPPGNPRDAAAIVSAVEPPAVVDHLLFSFLESVGAGSSLPLFRAAGLSDQSLHIISEMTPQTIYQFGLSPDQAPEFSIRVAQHLTDQFLQKEALEVRALVENAGFDYSVFASVDSESQQEILTSLKRRRRNIEPLQGPAQAVPDHRPSFDWDPVRSSQLQESSEHSARVSVADMAGEGQARSSGSLSQLDHAVSILAEFFPSMQAEAIADMLHCMGLRLDEAVDTILEDVSTSSSKRKSSSQTSVSRLDAVRQIGATRSGVEGADWKSVYSWISASTGQPSSGGSAGSASADTSLDSLVAFMKVAMNVDDPAVGAEQSLRERFRQLRSARGPDHQLTIVAACHLAACLVDQKKYSTASAFLQHALQWFTLNGGGVSDPSSLAALGGDTVKQYAHAQILYAECLIADARSNGETVYMLLSSMQAAKYRSQLPPPPERAKVDVDAGASSMDSEAAPGDGDAGGSQALICDACDMILTSSALCYRCVTCPDFTLCVPCHAKYEHCNSGHDFEVTNTRTPVPPRALCIASAHLQNALVLQPSLASLLNDVSLMKAKVCVAECYLLQRRYSESESIIRELVQNNASESRLAHPIIFRALMRLAMCLAAQFKWDESQTIFEKVLSHYDAQKGRNSADSLEVLLQISESFYRRGCPLSAISVLEDCHARHVSVRGKEDFLSLRCACMLGHFYAVLSDDARALAILNDAVVTACAAHGDASVAANHCKYHLGMALFTQKNITAALDQLMPLTNTTLIPVTDLVTRARLDIIMHKAKIAVLQCFAILNRLSEAIASLQELQSGHDSMFGRQHKYYGQTLVALARAQHLAGNVRSARCLFDKAVPLLSRLMGPQHHDVISANVAYASVLLELQQFGVAGPLLESTYALQVQCLGESHSSSVHTLSLVALCRSLRLDNSGLQLQQTSRSRSSSLSSSLQSSAQSSPTISEAWHHTDSEVSYWLLQQQSRDEASSADPPRAPAPPPNASRAAEAVSILQPIQDSEPSGASEDSASDIGD